MTFCRIKKILEANGWCLVRIRVHTTSSERLVILTLSRSLIMAVAILLLVL